MPAAGEAPAEDVTIPTADGMLVDGVGRPALDGMLADGDRLLLLSGRLVRWMWSSDNGALIAFSTLDSVMPGYPCRGLCGCSGGCMNFGSSPDVAMWSLKSVNML